MNHLPHEKTEFRLRPITANFIEILINRVIFLLMSVTKVGYIKLDAVT